MRARLARPVAHLREGRTDWYRITNKAATNSAELYIYDEIGYFGVSASDLVRDLNSLNVSTIELRINSPGGEVFDGMAIYNALRDHSATVNVTVDGLAASAASFIAMAGDKITMNRGSQMMIHDGLAVCVGNAGEMRSMADTLDQTSDQIASLYAERAGGSVTQWRDAMRAETWYTPESAVKAGLADVAAGVPATESATKNSWDLSIFPNWPGLQPAGQPVAQAQQVDSVPPAPAGPVSMNPNEPETVVSVVIPEAFDFAAAFAPIASMVTRPKPQQMDPDVFQAAMDLVLNNTPDRPAVTEQAEPDLGAPPVVPIIDPGDFERRLREAYVK